MKLSTRARYALRMMVEIARHSRGGDTVSLGDVAERTSMSRRYLEQLSIGLKNASLIRGVAGKGGGYRLVRPPEEIRIGQIIEAAIGPINVVDCVSEPESCPKSERCECRWVYRLINDRILGGLDEISLADMCDRKRLEGIAKRQLADEAARRRSGRSKQGTRAGGSR